MATTQENREATPGSRFASANVVHASSLWPLKLEGSPRKVHTMVSRFNAHLLQTGALALFALTLAPAGQATAQMTPPTVKKHLYSENADPKSDIAAAIKQAGREHKRVILDFGGDWCGDCQVLDIYFHQAPNLELLDKNFLLVHVDIGRFDKNLDIPEKYNIPLKKGVPALAVLDASGKLLYSQQTAEF